MEASYLLGMIYKYGSMASKDLAKSKMYFQKTADLGHEKAPHEVHVLEALAKVTY